MTLVALVAIIALAAGGLIVVMLAIATHVEPIDDDASAPAWSAPPPRSQLTRAMPAPSDAPSPREAPEAATAQARKPPRRPAWHGIAQAWTSWRRRHADDLLYFGARRRRRALYKEWAGWLTAVVAVPVVLAYLIVHI